MSTPLTRSQARTWTIGAQAGALICVLGAVAVGVVGLPDHREGAALQQARESTNPGGGAAGNKDNTTREIDPYRSTGVDTLGLAERLALLNNAPDIPVEQPEEPTTGDPEPTDGPGIDDITITRRVKYIGFINSTETQHAFIRIDGKQRIVSVGDMARAGDEQFSDLRVDRITPQFIIMSDGENRSTVNLATKSGPSVTMVEGDSIEVAAVENNDGSLLTAEEEAYIESLPPRQRQNARRRLEREKRGLSAEPNRRPTPEPLVTIRGNAGENNSRPNIERREDRRDD